MSLSLGFLFIYKTPIYERAAAERVASLLTDPRLPWQPALVRPDGRSGHAVYPWPPGKIAARELRETVIDVLTSDCTNGINLVSSRQEKLNHAWFHLHSGRWDVTDEGKAFPFPGRGICRSAGKPLDGWVDVVHELARVLAIAHGVIFAGEDERPISSLQYGIGKHQPRMPQDYPHNETERVRRVERELGERYVRPPRWGTYLRGEHVAAVGGRAKIAEVVQPPVMREVGPLLYVQLSERVEDAVAPETEARRKVFTELLEPITVPRVPAST